MPSSSERIILHGKTVGGEKVIIKVATGIANDGSDGTTQTINVFDSSGVEGNYSEVYRLPWEDRLMEPKLLERLIRTLEELDVFLMASWRGERRAESYLMMG